MVENVVRGSNVITDGWSGYRPIGEWGFLHEVRVVRPKEAGTENLLPNVHRVVAFLKMLANSRERLLQPQAAPDGYLDEIILSFVITFH